MDETFYNITIENLNLKVERNNLGYCFSLNSFGQTDVLVYSTLEESLNMMEHVLNLLS